MNYNATMTELADAIRSKSGAEGKLTIPQMIEAVNGIFGEGGAFDLVLVTENKPYSPEITAPTRVIVSGIGFIGEQEYDYGVDGTPANGTYLIMPGYETAQGMNCGYDPSLVEEPEFSSKHWYISSKIGWYGWNALIYRNGENIPEGTNTWENDNYGSASVTTSVVFVTVPEQQFTLKAKTVKSYDAENHIYEFGPEKNLSGFEKEAVVSNVYASTNGIVLGNAIGFYTGLPSFEAVFYAPLTTTDTKALTGQTLDIKGSNTAAEYMGRKCLHIAGDVLNIPITNNSSGLVGGKKDFTLHIRACFKQFNAGGIWVLGSNDYNGIAINLAESSGNYYLSYSDANGNSYNSGDHQAQLDTWYSICLIRKDGVAYFYVNGTLARQGDFNHRVDYYDGYTGIGGRNANGYGSTYKDLYVCDAIMYDRVITGKEIELLRG